MVVRGVDLTVPSGTALGILGANGAGKTTLLAGISGLRPAQAGSVAVLGVRLPTRDRRLLGRIGMVAQDTALYPELTVREQLALFAELYALDQPAAAIQAMLGLLRLEGAADERAGRLSGGMRRRVAVARALLHRPELVLADEPTLAVDTDTRLLIWRHLRELTAAGVSVVIATNDLEEARAVCTSVAILADGGIARQLAVSSLHAGATLQELLRPGGTSP